MPMPSLLGAKSTHVSFPVERSFSKAAPFLTKARLRPEFLAWFFPPVSSAIDRADGSTIEAKKFLVVTRAGASARQDTRIHV
jgi:hypothetical protein